MIRVLFSAHPRNWDAYEAPLRSALSAAGLDAELGLDFPPETVDYIVYAPSSALQDFRPYTRLKAVLNLWAGVENVVGNETLTVPLARMVDPGMTEGMVEWVLGHVLRHHINIDHALAHQSGQWVRHIPPLARERSVAVLGLGALGSACARAIAALNFDTLGWSRGPKQIAGVTCHAGEAGLDTVLDKAEIVVLLVPLTPLTRNLMNAERLARLPRGAILINPGRGPLIDDDALLAALDRGHLAHATLDVFRTEPLPPDHPFWAHPKVTVTPHIASETRPLTAAQSIARNIARSEAGEPLMHVVDRRAGY